jgi:hypothetical protein
VKPGTEAGVTAGVSGEAGVGDGDDEVDAAPPELDDGAVEHAAAPPIARSAAARPG